MYRPPNDTIFIDLNSCFATIEQQARPMLRGRPVAIFRRRCNEVYRRGRN